jgi:hypothetical protein
MGKGSSAPPQPQNQTVTQTNLPEYARPYFENLLERSQAESYRDYTPYEGQRLEGFTPQQEAIRGEAMGMTTPGQFAPASNIAQQAAMQSLGTQYDPTRFNYMGVQAPSLNQYQMGPFERVQGQQFGAPQMGTATTGFQPTLDQFQIQAPGQYQAPQMGLAQTGFAPNLRDVQIQAPGQYEAPTMEAAQTGFSPALERFQMTAPETFGAEQAQQYMSPYMQEVLDVQKREAVRDAEKAQLGANLGAARQGTYGGARQLLAQTERERGLREQLGDIQSRGLETAFGQAQSQFERDRAAQMAAQRENLQSALGVQELGTTTGLQAALANLNTDQQSRVQNQAAQLQTQGMSADQALRTALANQQATLGVQELGTQTGLQTSLANLSASQQQNVQNLAAQLQTQGMNADQALRTALANQQAGLGVQELGTQAGLQTALANLSSEQQANVQNLAAQLQTQGLNADQALRSALANQQAGLTTDQQNLAARLGVQELGTRTGMEAQLANQQAMLEAQRLGEQSRQFGSSLGLQGLGQAITGAGQLGQLGTSQQAADLQRLQAQAAAAGEPRAYQQQLLDMQYADFLRQRDYPMEQLGYFSNILRGLPVQMGSTATTYAQPPSFAQQLGGVGLAGLGLYNMTR